MHDIITTVIFEYRKKERIVPERPVMQILQLFKRVRRLCEAPPGNGYYILYKHQRLPAYSVTL
jgi:hypothetical protein